MKNEDVEHGRDSEDNAEDTRTQIAISEKHKNIPVDSSSYITNITLNIYMPIGKQLE